jgi:hypothetical protein
MEDRPSSKHRKHRDKQRGHFTEPGSSNGKEYRSDIYQYGKKRTPTPSSHCDSYGDNLHTTAGSKVSRTSSRSGDFCSNCSRPHSRNDVVPLEKKCYNTQDGFSNTPIMLPKKSTPKMDSFQNKNPNDFILKKRVRFQLNPSKSTPNFRQTAENNSHAVSELKHYGLQKNSQAIHSRDTEQIPFSYETYTMPLVDKPYFYIHEDDIHSPNSRLGKSKDDSSSSQRYKSMYRDLSNLDLCWQDTNDLFGSDTTSGSDKDGELNSKETSLRPRARKDNPPLQQSRVSRRKNSIELSNVPSRLPRQVTKIAESSRSQSDSDEPRHNAQKPLNSTSQRGRTLTKEETDGKFKEYEPDFRQSNNSSRTIHELNNKNKEHRRIWQPREYNKANTVSYMLSEEIMSSDSSEDDDSFYKLMRQQAKNKVHRERLVPDNAYKDVGQYVLDLNRLESSDNDYNMEYKEKPLTSRPSQSRNRNFVGTSIRGKMDDRDLSYKVCNHTKLMNVRRHLIQQCFQNRTTDQREGKIRKAK